MQHTPASTAVPALVDRVREGVLLGHLRPGERLIEDELISRFGGTRHAVRAALQALAHEGLVVHHSHRGAKVRDFEPEEVEEITAVREVLHAAAARRVPLPVPAEMLASLEVIEAAHAAAVARGDPSTIHYENERFHAALFAACGNRHLARTIEDYAKLSLGFRCRAMADPALARRARDEHRAMLDALRDGDREALVRLCVGHTALAVGRRQAPRPDRF